MDRSKRIAALEQEKQQIANRILRLRNLEAAKERKLRTRRLILIGSCMEHLTQDDPNRKARLIKELDGFLQRPRDRELFDLQPKETAK